MKITTKETVSTEQLKEALTKQFPDYQVTNRTKAILVVRKSDSSAAAIVMAGNGRITVNEGFATMGGQMVFTLTMILLGILIPLIIYFIAFFPKQKAIRNEVGEFVKSKYGAA